MVIICKKTYRRPPVILAQREVGTREHRPTTVKGILRRVSVSIFKVS